MQTFFKVNFFKKSLRNTIRLSNGLDPDLDQHSVSSDLGQNCLQRLSADDNFAASKEKVKSNSQVYIIHSGSFCIKITCHGMLHTTYSKTCVKRPLSKRPKSGFQDQLLLNTGQKYCRMLLH